MAKQITNKNTFYNSHTYNLSCFCHLYVRTMIDAGDLSVNKNFPPSQRMQINYERKKNENIEMLQTVFLSYFTYLVVGHAPPGACMEVRG